MTFQNTFYLWLLSAIFIYAVLAALVNWFATQILNALNYIKNKRAQKQNAKETHQERTLEELPSATASGNTIQAAIEIWRIQNRVRKISQQIPDAHIRGFQNSIKKLNDHFRAYGIEVVDPTGEPYNDGANVDVIAFETDPTLNHDIIKETLEPFIYENGSLIKRAKIIVHQRGN